MVSAANYASFSTSCVTLTPATLFLNLRIDNAQQIDIRLDRFDDHLQAVEEVVADDDDGGAARGPALARRYRLDARDRRRRVKTFERR